MPGFEFRSYTISGAPDFHDFPWELPLDEWHHHVLGLEHVQQGISRHPVVFINFSGNLYAIKELPINIAKKEYDILTQMNELQMPTITPVGYAELTRST